MLCIALNKKAAGVAGKLFEARTVSKRYLALVEGHPTWEHMRVERGVGEDAEDARGFRMSLEGQPGCTKPLPATTDCYVVDRGMLHGKRVSKLLLCPQSGRRHQLRLHCLVLGHPVVGDVAYTGDRSSPRMMLHAWMLRLPLPKTRAKPNQARSPTRAAPPPPTCSLSPHMRPAPVACAPAEAAQASISLHLSAPLLCASHHDVLPDQETICISSFDPYPAASSAWGRRGVPSKVTAAPAVREVEESDFEVEATLRSLQPRTVQSVGRGLHAPAPTVGPPRRCFTLVRASRGWSGRSEGSGGRVTADLRRPGPP